MSDLTLERKMEKKDILHGSKGILHYSWQNIQAFLYLYWTIWNRKRGKRKSCFFFFTLFIVRRKWNINVWKILFREEPPRQSQWQIRPYSIFPPEFWQLFLLLQPCWRSPPLSCRLFAFLFPVYIYFLRVYIYLYGFGRERTVFVFSFLCPTTSHQNDKLFLLSGRPDFSRLGSLFCCLHKQAARIKLTKYSIYTASVVERKFKI